MDEFKPEDFYSDEGRLVLCGASAYDEKYYLNPVFEGMPIGILDELKIICVLYVRDVGGVFTLEFNEDGEVETVSRCDEEDITYDHIHAGVLAGKLRAERVDLFESLSAYYKVVIMGMNPADVLLDFDDE